MDNIWIEPWANFPQYMDHTFLSVPLAYEYLPLVQLYTFFWLKLYHLMMHPPFYSSREIICKTIRLSTAISHIYHNMVGHPMPLPIVRHVFIVLQRLIWSLLKLLILCQFVCPIYLFVCPCIIQHLMLIALHLNKIIYIEPGSFSWLKNDP